MVDKACLKCSWHDPEYECICPVNEPWQCPLDKKATEELNQLVTN